MEHNRKIAPLVISFYTENTPYEEEIKGLVASCTRWNIEHCIEGKASLGSWEKNCAQKPFFILEKLMEHERPVFWVDADAVFLSPPDFEQFREADFSVRINSTLPDQHPSKVISNTIYVNHTNQGRAILKTWCELSLNELDDPERKEEFWDQISLRDALFLHKSARVKPMPLGYAKIFDSDFFHIAPNEVVLEHYQASRRFKKLIQ